MSTRHDGRGCVRWERVYYYVPHRCPFDYFKGVGFGEREYVSTLGFAFNYVKCHFILLP